MRGTVFMLVVAALAACGPKAEPPAAPTVEAPRDAARLGAVSPVALAADGVSVYYADLEGVWAQSVLGGDARLVTAPPKLVEAIVPHGDELVLGTADGLLAVPTVGGPVRTVHAGAVDWFAVQDTTIWFVAGGALRSVPLAGGAAQTVAADLGEVVAPIVTDADAVYAAIALDETVAISRKRDVQAAAIVRISMRDGARSVLAKRQFGVASLLQRDGALYWTSFGAGLRSVAARAGTGNAVVTHLGGGGVALAADADGIVVQTTTGLWIEVRPGGREGAHVATGTRTRAPEKTPGFVLAGGAIVALVTEPDASQSELWREVRPWRSPVKVAGWVTDGMRELIATDDGVIVLDALLDEEATGRVLKIDARGRRTVLASAKAMSELAVDGDQLAYRAGDAIWRKRGTAAPVRAVAVGDERVLGLVLRGDTFYWSDSQTVRSASAGGAPATFFDDPGRRSAGTGRPDASLVVEGTTVYFNQLGWISHGVQRVVNAETAQSLYEPPDGTWPGDQLVRAGDAFYVTTSENEIMRVPLAGGGGRVVIKGGEYPFRDLVGGGDRLVTEYYTDDGEVIAAVDPIAGKVTPVATLATESSLRLAVTPSGDALYVGLLDSDLIVRMPLPPKR
ncbi:MAG TPA: hypothetical protein VM261_11795 [Kofleriaceae bacterium]|nr:hypothetical protein [Kofleriaceae bacterium]